ncbi:MFS transporter [Anaerospora hongkongensis]|uniref:MFS transporter n=1 Tax=Anaerospora hongkongensis TaxID=244830 RepID=UPI002899E82A|nr:MFS transporter [Anaerospora hongkongensis]
MSVLVQLFANRQFQCIALVQMLTVFSTNLLAPVLPVHFKLQGLSEAEIGFIMGVVSLGALVVRPWSGLSVDLRGSRWTILFGQMLTTIGIAAFVWTTNFWPLLLLRFFQGIAMAFYGTGAITFASCVETPENTSAAIAYFSLFTMIGLGLGTSIAPLTYGSLGFSTVIAISLTAVLGALLFMWFGSRPVPRCESDLRVAFRTVLTMKVVLAPSVCLFASNFALGTAFTFVPLLALAQGIGQYFVFFVAFSVAVVCARLGVQTINSRWGAVRTSIGASMLNALSALLLAVLPSVFTYAVAGILIGFGFGIVYPTLAGYLVQHVNPANKGTALSILSGAGDIGNALGASVLGIVAQTLGFTAVFSGAALVIAACTYYFQSALLTRRQAGMH